MPTDVLRDRPRPEQTRASDVAIWEATHLRVRDLEQALPFWQGLLGLSIHRASAGEVALGVADAELIVLHAGATRPALGGHAGLYHVALHLPSARDFAQMLVRLVTRKVDPRPTDHLLHWAMYLSDPDGIGVELSFETADRFDYVIPGRNAILVGTDGHRQGPVEALDVRATLEAFPDVGVDQPMPAGTRVGHNHLHVADLASATRFYEHLGLVANASFMGMRDFNARGTFLHRLAINEWQGHGAPPAPLDAAGLHHLRLSYRDEGAFRDALGALDRNGSPVRELEQRDGISLSDPSGNEIELSAVVEV